MNVEQTWESQATPPIGKEKLREVVTSHVASSRRQIRISFLFCIACVAGAVFNFYGQFVVNGDPLLVAALRFSMVLIVIPFQWHAWWSLKKKHDERLNSQLDQKTWLTKMVEDLHQELYKPAYWKLALFSIVMVVLMSVVKWLDYQYGLDSATECVAIVMVVVLLILAVFAGVWHHRTTVLVPRYERYQALLGLISSPEPTTDA